MRTAKRKPLTLAIPRWAPAALAVAVLAFGTPGSARADYVDLTQQGTTTINKAIFDTTTADINAGTGVTNTFEEIGGSKSVTQGYNTTANVLDNGSSATFNHEVKLSDVPIVTIGDTQYFQFRLDINENNSVDKYLSLDQVKIYTSNTPNQNTTNPDNLGTKQYDTGGTGVLLNYDLHSGGSGKGDMILDIPVFTTSDTYVYLYSHFGGAGVLDSSNPWGAPAGNYGNSDGYEHWFLLGPGVTPNVPEPSTIALALCGLVSLRLLKRLRTRPTEAVSA